MKDHLAFSFFFGLFHLECDRIQFLCEEEEEEEKKQELDFKRSRFGHYLALVVNIRS